MSDDKPTLHLRGTIKLGERTEGPHFERWQADYGEHHGLGGSRAQALRHLAAALDRADWEALPPDRRICPTCGTWGGHELGCKDDPNPAARKSKRASRKGS